MNKFFNRFCVSLIVSACIGGAIGILFSSDALGFLACGLSVAILAIWTTAP